MMIIQTISIKEMGLFSELLIGISLIYLVLFGLFVSYNPAHKFPLVQSATINLTILTIILSCVLLYNDKIFYDGGYGGVISFNGAVNLDYMGYFIKLLIGVSSIVCLIMIKQYLSDQKINFFEYTVVILFAVLGLFLLCSANDFLTAYLAIELQSLAFYILAAFKKDSTYSVESGLKYFILGAFSSGFFLFGISLVYGTIGSIEFEDMRGFYVESAAYSSVDIFFESAIRIMSSDWSFFKFLDYPQEFIFPENNYQAPSVSKFYMYAVVFIIVSLLFKLSIAPFHAWSPDVYEGSPTGSVFFFSVVPKLSIILLLFRIFSYLFVQFAVSWQYCFVGLAVLSVIVGSVAGVEQRKIKSLLAYSSISHMGYILLAVSSNNVVETTENLVYYLIVYTVSGLCIWSAFLLIRLKDSYLKKQNKDLAVFALLRKSNSMLATVVTAALFSLAGLPPMIGFLAKLGIFFVAMKSNMYMTVLVTILFSVISTFYYIRIIKILYFEPVLTGKLYYPINSQKSLIIALLFFILLFLFINPNLLSLVSYRVAMAF